METFPDRFFDYIYLDACHDFFSAQKDTAVIKKKIKSGGIIAFNDYTLLDFYSAATPSPLYYGVVPAANKLINESNSKVLFFALEKRMFCDLVVQYWE